MSIVSKAQGKMDDGNVFYRMLSPEKYPHWGKINDLLVKFLPRIGYHDKNRTDPFIISAEEIYQNAVKAHARNNVKDAPETTIIWNPKGIQFSVLNIGKYDYSQVKPIKMPNGDYSFITSGRGRIVASNNSDHLRIDVYKQDEIWMTEVSVFLFKKGFSFPRYDMGKYFYNQDGQPHMDLTEVDPLLNPTLDDLGLKEELENILYESALLAGFSGSTIENVINKGTDLYFPKSPFYMCCDGTNIVMASSGKKDKWACVKRND